MQTLQANCVKASLVDKVSEPKVNGSQAPQADLPAVSETSTSSGKTVSANLTEHLADVKNTIRCVCFNWPLHEVIIVCCPNVHVWRPGMPQPHLHFITFCLLHCQLKCSLVVEPVVDLCHLVEPLAALFLLASLEPLECTSVPVGPACCQNASKAVLQRTDGSLRRMDVCLSGTWIK